MNLTSIRLSGTVLLFASAGLAALVPARLAAGDEGPRNWRRTVRLYPDMPQSQRSLPGNGSQYCAPVAASNGLMFLGRSGYPDLAPSSQADLAAKLGTREYMDTSVRNGTSAGDVVAGLERYVVDCGYEVESITYQGWRPVPDEVDRLDGHADVERLASSLDGRTLVLLNVGWYRRNRAGSTFERVGGHWVTMVGAEPSNPPKLFIHDPSSRSREGQHEAVLVRQITGGELTGNKRGLPTPADRAWELGGELRIKTSGGGNTSVLDGVIVVKLKHPNG